MTEPFGYTPEQIAEMGYDAGVVDFFMQVSPDLLAFMWGNGSAHYDAILKNTIEDDRLIPTAGLQMQLEGRVGNTAASSLLMAAYRLSHPQTPPDVTEG